MELAQSKNTKIFQSYIFVGTNSATTRALQEFAASLKIDINRASADISTIRPLKKTISIEQIRTLKNDIYQKPFSLPYKLVVIEEADGLTHQAQNALLKVFEEPPGQSIIILRVKNIKSLLPTITSRATIISSHSKSKEESPVSTITQKEALLNLDKTDAEDWIDKQVEIQFRYLLEELKTNKHPKDQLKLIEKLTRAKLMLEHNINPKFVLADILLSATKWLA